MNNKKLIAGMLALTMVFGVGGTIVGFDKDVFAVSASAENDLDLYEYEETDEGISITKIKSEERSWDDPKEVVYHVPEKINGKPVIGLADGSIDYDEIDIIYLPKTLKYIPLNEENDGLVNICKNIFVDKDNPYFIDIDGVLFSKDKKKLLAYPMKKNEGAEYVVPNSVVELGQGAFCDAYIEQIKLPDDLEIIGDHCFWCSRLEYLFVPSKVKELDREAFEGCCPINKVDVSPDNQYFCSVDGILYSKDMTYMIFFPNGMETEKLSVPDGVRRIHWNCIGGSYKELYIPASVEEIGSSISRTGLWSLDAEKITVAADNPNFYSVDGVLYDQEEIVMYPPQKKDTEYTTSKDATYVVSGAFYWNKYLKYLTISEGVKTTGMISFGDMDNLRALYLPSTLEHCASLWSEYSAPQKFSAVYFGGTEEQFKQITAGLFGNKKLADVCKENNIKVVYNAKGIPDEVKNAHEKGDVNGDDEINVTDIAMVASHIKGIKALDGDGLTNADVNADKQVNVTDIAMIASHITGIKALQ